MGEWSPRPKTQLEMAQEMVVVPTEADAAKLLRVARFRGSVKERWLWMLEPPWRNTGMRTERRGHWRTWILGWAWAVAGLTIGAAIAPLAVRFVGFSNSTYQDWLIIGLAVVGGFLIQLLGWGLLSLGLALISVLSPTSLGPVRSRFLFLHQPFYPRSLRYHRTTAKVYRPFAERLSYWLGSLLYPVIVVLPFAAVGYGFYLWLTWVGPDQREVTIAFVGGLLLKTFLIPFIKGIVTGALFKWFMNWLRGGKDTKAASQPARETSLLP